MSFFQMQDMFLKQLEGKWNHLYTNYSMQKKAVYIKFRKSWNGVWSLGRELNL